jgi:RNA polymerase sigma-70 factor (ECF subfamily)
MGIDRELVVRARAGDHEAFSQVVAATLGRLIAVARLIMRDEDSAQDAVQDAFVDAWKDIRGLRDPDRLEAWMYRLLVHACRTRARREHARRTLQVRQVRLEAWQGDVEASSESAVVLHDQVERALRRLSTDQRAVLVLVYYLDLSLADAARVLGIPIGTMKSRLSRATQALRAALDADAREPMVVQGRPA